MYVGRREREGGRERERERERRKQIEENYVTGGE
jgi:hypothetical protein